MNVGINCQSERQDAQEIQDSVAQRGTGVTQEEMGRFVKIQIETQYVQDGAWDSGAGPRPYLRGKTLGELG